MQQRLRKKEEETLDFQQNKCDSDEGKDMKKKKKSLKKNNAINADYRNLTNATGKVKKHRLRKLEVEVVKEVATVRSKDKISHTITVLSIACIIAYHI